MEKQEKLSKKYWIAPHNRGLLLLIYFFLCMPGIIVLFFGVEKTKLDGSLIAVSALGIVVMTCQLFVDPIWLGKFSADSRGIVICLLSGKKRCHPWDSFQEVFVTNTINTRDGVRLFWVAFSKKALTLDERNRFIQKTRWNRTRTMVNLEDFAYFQAGVEIMEEIIPLLPPTLAEPLRKEQAALGMLLQSNKRERRMNKR